MILIEIRHVINKCLKKLYRRDESLFIGKGLCERCLVFRFAMYLQEAFRHYYVDCDYNSSMVNGHRTSGKLIGKTKRFIDIIVHDRGSNDFICFEVKKWNNMRTKDILKDYENLMVLTAEGSAGYGYKYGFHLVLGKSLSSSKLKIFQHGKKIAEY